MLSISMTNIPGIMQKLKVRVDRNIYFLVIAGF